MKKMVNKQKPLPKETKSTDKEIKELIENPIEYDKPENKAVKKTKPIPPIKPKHPNKPIHHKKYKHPSKLQHQKAVKKHIEKTIEKGIKESIKPKPQKPPKQPTLQLKSERDIAMDFAQKVYQKFDKMVKSVILFGSTVKNTKVSGSDIDVIIIVDDAIINFDEKLVAWYREELGNIISSSPYKRDLHINTVKLTTWWQDLIRGDPTIINIIRYGEALIDFAGFFDPLRILLHEGKIKTTPESIYTTLNRVPGHIMRSRLAEIGAIEGCYWAMVESAQALLMTIKVVPPSPEHIAILLKEHFVDKKLLKIRSVIDLRDLYELHRRIVHGDIQNLDGKIIDEWQNKAEEFFKTAMKIINDIVEVQ